MTIASHTLVKSGMPFVGLVLEQAIPFVTRCLITVSERSNDGTLGILKELQLQHPSKIFIDFEHVNSPGELTKERQRQVDRTTEDWIWFLDDDDFWPTESVKQTLGQFENDIDGLAVNPYQVIDENTYDAGWWNKWFTKFFRNKPGINYRNPWPRDMIYLNDEVLYWKKNPRVKRIAPRFFHLSYLKDRSFRKEEWAKVFEQKVGAVALIPQEEKIYIEKIYECTRRYK